MDGMQLPLVRRFASEGHMPNLSHLMAEGSFGQLLPSIPAYTPTNWAAISTGASPGSTGLGGWYVRKYEDPWEKGLSAFDSRALRAETIMEAADRQGLRVLTIFYPNSWPPVVKNGYSVAPFYSGKGILPFPITGPATYSSGPGRKDGSQVRFVRPSGWRNLPNNECLATEIDIKPQPRPLVAEYDADEKVSSDIERKRILPSVKLHLLVCEKPTVRLWVCTEKDVQTAIVEARGREWSNWGTLKFGDVWGSVRFKPLQIDFAASQVTFVRSQIYPVEGFAFPGFLARDIFEKVGPFIERPSIGAAQDPDTCFEDFLYQGLWMARTAAYLQERVGWDLYIHHYHILDSISHGFLAQSDPTWPFYDAESGKRNLEVLRRSYEVVDRVVGEFLKMADEKTYFVVISDHGNAPNSWICDTMSFLMEVGLMAFKETETGDREIDWNRSKVYMIPQRQLEIFVNLKGRDFAGSVDPKDYEAVQQEVIDALYDWKEPTTGRRPVALALKKRDASLLGFWGNEECGDVVFVYNAGFGRGHPEGGRSLAPAIKGGANHGPQLPTTQTGFSSNLACLFIKGPGLKKGYERDEARYGPWRILDFAPTLSYLLGIDPPKHAEGRVMRDILE